MDDKAIERFRNRRKRLERIHSQREVSVPEVSDDEVQEFLNSKMDSDWLAILSSSQDSHYKVTFCSRASHAEVSATLDEIRGQVTVNEFDQLLSGVREQVLHAVIRPFGLAKVLFKDKDGGNVTTIHNMQQGLPAAKTAHEYRRDSYTKFKAQRSMLDFKKSRINANQQLQDTYTGVFLDVEQTETDHIHPLKAFHVDGGFMLCDERKVNFAADRENFAVTKQEINRSKRDQELNKFETRTVQKKLVKNKNRFGTDGRRTRSAVERGKKTAQKHQPSIGEKSSFYTKEVVSSGSSEAASLGVQQAIGLLLHELASGLVDEARDFFRRWRGGTLSAGVFRELKAGFQRLGRRVISRWDDALKAFVDGGISGFISNLVTFVINCFVTTFKRVVGIIREGALSLLRAFKLLLFPPEGMTRQEAAHEATKIVAAGLAVAAGLGVEEFVSKSLMILLPLLAPLADSIATVIVGILTGIGAAILVYLLDKIDFFGVNRKRKHKLVMAELECMAGAAMAEAEEDFRMFDDPSVQPA
jgi:hypothetical protein